MIVVDANILAYFVLPGNFSEGCSALYDRDPVWMAPSLWRAELANVLATYQRRGGLSRIDGIRAFDDAEHAVLGREYLVSIERILEVAARTGCSGYDAHYVALAEDLGLHLYTYDKHVLQTCSHIARRP